MGRDTAFPSSYFQGGIHVGWPFRVSSQKEDLPKGVVTTIRLDDYAGNYHLFRFYATQNGVAVYQERQSKRMGPDGTYADERFARFSDVDGETREARLDHFLPYVLSETPDFERGVEIALGVMEMTAVDRMARGAWGLKHAGLLKPVSKSAYLEEVKALDVHAIQVGRHGYVPDDERHGGAILEELTNASDGFIPDEKITFPVRDPRNFYRELNPVQLTPKGMLETYKHCLKMPGSDFWLKAGMLPDLDCNFSVDSYAYLSVLLREVPVEGWSRPWKTIHGEKLSIHAVMRGALEGYRNWDGSTDEGYVHISHSHLHAPALLLDYFEKTGRDPNEIKALFLNRELSGDQREEHPDRYSFSIVAHYTESLGLLMDSGAMTWSDADRAVARDWIEYALTVYAVAKDQSAELSHMIRGLRLIRKNLHKIS